MNTLPFDYARCQPVEPGDKCSNCKRWWNHPEQVCNPYGQSFVAVKNSKAPACHYMPISYQEKV